MKQILHLKLLTTSLSFHDGVISRGGSLFLFHRVLKNVRSQREVVRLQINYLILNYTTQWADKILNKCPSERSQGVYGFSRINNVSDNLSFSLFTDVEMERESTKGRYECVASRGTRP